MSHLSDKYDMSFNKTAEEQMSYRMPFPAPHLVIHLVILVIALVVVVIVKGITGLFPSQDGVERTNSILAQIVESVNGRKTLELPHDASSLAALLKKSDIDWNGCQLSEDRIRDSWGNDIRAELEESSMIWRLRSAGEDGQFGTIDDIHLASRSRKVGEPAGAAQPATRPSTKAP